MQFFHQLASPKYFYHVASRIVPWTSALTALLFAAGLYMGLWLAPPDYQQGDGFRIMYIHVPAATLSLGIYSFMALLAVIHLIWRIKLANLCIRASAPIGAWFTLLALISGAIWGKPMWGTWWVWDARLTSELVLLFLYVGFIALQTAIPDKQQAALAGQILLLVGAVDVPIIHYSVNWWNTLHQGSSLGLFSKPTIASSMLWPLLILFAAFASLYLSLLLIRMRSEILLHERHSQWVKNLFFHEGVTR